MEKFNPIERAYTSTRDLSQMASTYDAVQNRHDKAVVEQSNLNATIGALDMNEAEDEFKQNMLDDINYQIADSAIQGNLASSYNEIITKAGNVMSDPRVLGRLKSQQAYKANLDKIDKAQVSDDIKTYHKAMNTYHYEDKTDENGRVIGGSTWTAKTEPVNSFDIGTLLDKAIAKAGVDKGAYGSTKYLDENGKVTNDPNKMVTATFTRTTESGTTELSSVKIEGLLADYIESNPHAKASLKQDYDVAKWQYDKDGTDNEILDPVGIPYTEDEYIANQIKGLGKDAAYKQTTYVTSDKLITNRKSLANAAMSVGNNSASRIANGENTTKSKPLEQVRQEATAIRDTWNISKSNTINLAESMGIDSNSLNGKSIAEQYSMLREQAYKIEDVNKRAVAIGQIDLNNREALEAELNYNNLVSFATDEQKEAFLYDGTIQKGRTIFDDNASKAAAAIYTDGVTATKLYIPPAAIEAVLANSDWDELKNTVFAGSDITGSKPFINLNKDQAANLTMLADIAQLASGYGDTDYVTVGATDYSLEAMQNVDLKNVGAKVRNALNWMSGGTGKNKTTDKEARIVDGKPELRVSLGDKDRGTSFWDSAANSVTEFVSADATTGVGANALNVFLDIREEANKTIKGVDTGVYVSEGNMSHESNLVNLTNNQLVAKGALEESTANTRNRLNDDAVLKLIGGAGFTDTPFYSDNGEVADPLRKVNNEDQQEVIKALNNAIYSGNNTVNAYATYYAGKMGTVIKFDVPDGEDKSKTYTVFTESIDDTSRQMLENDPEYRSEVKVDRLLVNQGYSVISAGSDGLGDVIMNYNTKAKEAGDARVITLTTSKGTSHFTPDEAKDVYNSLATLNDLDGVIMQSIPDYAKLPPESAYDAIRRTMQAGHQSDINVVNATSGKVKTTRDMYYTYGLDRLTGVNYDDLMRYETLDDARSGLGL